MFELWRTKEQIIWQNFWNEKGTFFYVIHNGFCYIAGVENLTKNLLCNDSLSEKKNAYFELYELPFFAHNASREPHNSG